MLKTCFVLNPSFCSILVSVYYLKSRKIFWTDSGSPPQISSMNINGTSKLVLFSQDMLRPTGLAVDASGETNLFSQKKYYFCMPTYL